MKEIISTVKKVLDASEPTKTNLILFKDFRTSYNVTDQSEVFAFGSFKVVEAADDGEETYQLLNQHTISMGKDELDALRAAMTIESTDYVDVRNEEILKGAKIVIVNKGLFGLTASKLVIR